MPPTFLRKNVLHGQHDSEELPPLLSGLDTGPAIEETEIDSEQRGSVTIPSYAATLKSPSVVAQVSAEDSRRRDMRRFRLSRH
jgi:hypothetical protein